MLLQQQQQHFFLQQLQQHQQKQMLLKQQIVSASALPYPPTAPKSEPVDPVSFEGAAASATSVAPVVKSEDTAQGSGTSLGFGPNVPQTANPPALGVGGGLPGQMPQVLRASFSRA